MGRMSRGQDSSTDLSLLPHGWVTQPGTVPKQSRQCFPVLPCGRCTATTCSACSPRLYVLLRLPRLGGARTVAWHCDAITIQRTVLLLLLLLLLLLRRRWLLLLLLLLLLLRRRRWRRRWLLLLLTVLQASSRGVQGSNVSSQAVSKSAAAVVGPRASDDI